MKRHLVGTGRTGRAQDTFYVRCSCGFYKTDLKGNKRLKAVIKEHTKEIRQEPRRVQ